MRTPKGLPLGRVLGVPVVLAPSWFLFAAAIVVLYGPALEDTGVDDGYAAAALFSVLLLASVLLHEVGHCVVARLLGLPVRSITVTFLAGSTEITEPPQTPAREYAVAVAGPMVSLLLAGLAAAGALLVDGGAVQTALELAAVSNGVVAVFNLLPGLPLDGGRVLRAVLWRVTGDPHRATIASAQAGRGLAAVVVPLLVLVALPLAGADGGLVSAVFAGLVAAFLWVGASAALQSARLQRRLPSLTAGRLARDAALVPTETPLSEALRRTHEHALQAIVVVDPAGRPLAVVSESAVQAVPVERRPWVTVDGVSRRLEDGLVLTPDLTGEGLLARLRALPSGEYLVRDPAGGPVRVLAARDVARTLASREPVPASR